MSPSVHPPLGRWKRERRAAMHRRRGMDFEVPGLQLQLLAPRPRVAERASFRYDQSRRLLLREALIARGGSLPAHEVSRGGHADADYEHGWPHHSEHLVGLTISRVQQLDQRDGEAEGKKNYACVNASRGQVATHVSSRGYHLSC